MRVVILISFLLLFSRLEAQVTFTGSDSISYQLYLQKNWKALHRFSEKAKRDGVEFYFLDLRSGIAAYELGRWHEAEKYFLAALQKNSYGYVAQEYLFWIYYITDKRKEADLMYQQLPETAKANIDYKRSKIFSGLYSEAGLRLSTKPDSVGSNYYYNLGLFHQLSPRLRIEQSFSIFRQEFYRSRFDQQQYILSGSYDLGKAWKLGGSVSLVNFYRNFNLTDEQRTLIEHVLVPSPMGMLMKDSTLIQITKRSGNTRTTEFNLHLNFSKRWREFTFDIQTAYLADNFIPRYDSITTNIYRTELTQMNSLIRTIDSTGVQIKETYQSESISSVFQVGFSTDYTFRCSENCWIRPGIEAHTVLQSNQTNQMLVPYLEFVYLHKFSLFAYYFQKDNFPASIFDGTQLYNTYDKINHRFSITAGVSLTKKTALCITYQNEKLTDRFSGIKYGYNSGYIGLNIKL